MLRRRATDLLGAMQTLKCAYNAQDHGSKKAALFTLGLSRQPLDTL